jgi:hypothetical protein
MVEQVVEQVTTDIRVLPGMTVAERSRRQWTSMSMAEKRRRMLTKPVGKEAGD